MVSDFVDAAERPGVVPATTPPHRGVGRAGVGWRGAIRAFGEPTACRALPIGADIPNSESPWRTRSPWSLRPRSVAVRGREPGRPATHRADKAAAIMGNPTRPGDTSTPGRVFEPESVGWGDRAASRPDYRGDGPRAAWRHSHYGTGHIYNNLGLTAPR